jgi:hypothetical protein
MTASLAGIKRNRIVAIIAAAAVVLGAIATVGVIVAMQDAKASTLEALDACDPAGLVPGIRDPAVTRRGSRFAAPRPVSTTAIFASIGVGRGGRPERQKEQSRPPRRCQHTTGSGRSRSDVAS